MRADGVYVVRYDRNSRNASEELSTRAQRFVNEDSEELEYIDNYRLKVYKANLKQSNLVGETENEVVNELIAELNDEKPVEFASAAYRNVPEDKKDRSVSSDADDEGEYELMFVTNEFVVAFHPNIPTDRIEELNEKYDVTIVKELGYVDNGYLLQAPKGDGDFGPVALANTYFETGDVLFATPDFVRKRHIRSSTTARKRRVYRIADEMGLSNADVIDRLAEHGIYIKNNLSTVDEEAYRALLADEDGRADRLAATPKSGVPGERVSRSTYLDEQWHLDKANVRDAWGLTKGDPSIRIAIIDDGVDTLHPEFVHNTYWEYDYDEFTSDGRPKLSVDNHGTSCAGVAVAAGEKVYGVAPDCSLMAVRYPPHMGVAAEAEMFREVCDEGADVISCSWGPSKGRYTLTDNVRFAIDYCLNQGRVVDGEARGIPITWAAGNDDESVDTDGYASYESVIAVAASTSEDTHAWYSEYGDAIWVAAPSNGGQRAIFTTDRQGSDGYNTGSTADGDAVGNYFNDFGGTSSAAPLVAGVIGLMLSVDPELRQPDVKEILAKTAAQIGGVSYAVDPDDPLGVPRHPEFGYGRIDARGAVEESIGGSGVESTEPSIESIGSATVDRGDSPPQFSVDLGPNAVYVVEVATRAELFDDANHGGERSLENFYPVWATESPDYQTASTYALPAHVWDRLEETDELYYRMHSAESTAAGWPGYHVTTADTDSEFAPALTVTDTEGNGRPASDTSTGPSIEPIGTEPFDREGETPQFSVDLGPNAVYVVEVATRAELFDDANHGGERSLENFYPVWATESPDYQTASTYALPAHVWERLEEADELYYRMHSAESTAAGWPGYHVTTHDADAENAPSVTLAGRAPRRDRTIRGPERDRRHHLPMSG
ncbi:calcium dependent protease [Halogeometricum pallidum JCM 14848]|uniref:Calcium dependent protease n=1 Tax=Halogeometricum pallidum JCM 14848 TaxID=1227487 RepID=M0D9K7_HALPD|nr:calcium dependent protease [Halogeometricum pallidum JCM 14848]